MKRVNFAGLAARDNPAYLCAVQKGPAPAPPRFIPRATLALLATVVLFCVAVVLYSLPVMLAEPPPGAIPDWTAERVRAHLAGKVHWIFAGSALVVSAFAWRLGRR
jgi:hypothetical protein